MHGASTSRIITSRKGNLMAHEIMVTRRPQRVPTHPGEMVRDTVLPALELSVTAAAKHLKVSRVALSNVLHGHADLSADMAARMEKAFGLSMAQLLRMQIAHTEAVKRQHWDEIDVERFVSA